MNISVTGSSEVILTALNNSADYRAGEVTLTLGGSHYAGKKGRGRGGWGGDNTLCREWSQFV